MGEAGIALPGPGRARLSEGMGPGLSKPQRQSGALTADVLAVIRLTAVQPRRRGRGIETPQQAEERGRFDLAMVAALSDGGLRRSEASALTWGDIQRWDDGSGRITVIRSKDRRRGCRCRGGHHPRRHACPGHHPAVGVGGEVKVFGLSESQIARRVKAIAKAAGLADWEFFSGHSGRVGMARRMAQNGAPHPRDRTPGPLEAGRRHGRPLHSRRVRRIRPAISVAVAACSRTAFDTRMPTIPRSGQQWHPP